MGIMFKNKKLFTLLLIIIPLLYPGLHLSAEKASSSTKAGEQRKAEKGIKDNRYFIYYINSTISNFGTEEDKKKFEDIIKRDIVSQFFYMRYLFSGSYKQIRIAQKDMIDLYKKKLDDEITLTQSLLNSYAAPVIQSEDARARLYLRLGYRNVKHAEIDKGMADAYRTTLYSMRLYKYVKAMKKVKEGKRFAILCLIQINLTPLEKREEKKYDFEKISKLITEYAAKERESKLQLVHLDSYYRFKDNLSFYDEVWKNPDLENYPVFQEYLNSSF